MLNRSCYNCCFAGLCDITDGCEDYTPLYEHDEDIDIFIENKRTEFRSDWFKYIENN